MGLAFDKSGNLYEADQGSGNVYEFTSGGSSSIFVTGLNYPRSLAFDGSGNLFAGDRVGGDIYELRRACPLSPRDYRRQLGVYPRPRSGTFILLGIGAVSLLAYACRRGTKAS